jgi:hypothetical protein
VNGTAVPFSTRSPLDGIIAYLARECGGNVHTKGVVSVSASSTAGAGWEAENAADLTAHSCFGTPYPSTLGNGEWIQYDFGSRKISPSHYSIRSQHHHGTGFSHPKNWVVEISADGKKWSEVDRREDDNSLNEQNVLRSFQIVRLFVPARYVRLRLTGKTHGNTYSLRISGWELFGSLHDK